VKRSKLKIRFYGEIGTREALISNPIMDGHPVITAKSHIIEIPRFVCRRRVTAKILYSFFWQAVTVLQSLERDTTRVI
jgi:hypothetical protein